MTRRGFAAAGLGLLAGYGGWRWLVSRPDEDGIPWPLRRILRVNESLARATFNPRTKAREFPRERVGMLRENGWIGLDPVDENATWQLRVESDHGAPSVLSLEQIQALPRHEQTTELKCIEGWSTVVHWAGARLADLAATTGHGSRSGQRTKAGSVVPDPVEYVSLTTPDGLYYVGLDSPSAFHDQTLLCYEMNGEPLAEGHGAPLRLVIPVKYGIKHLKRIGTIRFTDRRPADYWAERGYDWYAGH